MQVVEEKDWDELPFQVEEPSVNAWTSWGGRALTLGYPLSALEQTDVRIGVATLGSFTRDREGNAEGLPGIMKGKNLEFMQGVLDSLVDTPFELFNVRASAFRGPLTNLHVDVHQVPRNLVRFVDPLLGPDMGMWLYKLVHFKASMGVLHGRRVIPIGLRPDLLLFIELDKAHLAPSLPPPSLVHPAPSPLARQERGAVRAEVKAKHGKDAVPKALAELSANMIGILHVIVTGTRKREVRCVPMYDPERPDETLPAHHDGMISVDFDVLEGQARANGMPECKNAWERMGSAHRWESFEGWRYAHYYWGPPLARRMHVFGCPLRQVNTGGCPLGEEGSLKSHKKRGKGKGPIQKTIDMIKRHQAQAAEAGEAWPGYMHSQGPEGRGMLPTR